MTEDELQLVRNYCERLIVTTGKRRRLRQRSNARRVARGERTTQFIQTSSNRKAAIPWVPAFNENIRDVRIENEDGDLIPVLDHAENWQPALIKSVVATGKAGAITRKST